MNKVLEAHTIVKQVLEREQFPVTAEGSLAKIYVEMAGRLLDQAHELLTKKQEVKNDNLLSSRD